MNKEKFKKFEKKWNIEPLENEYWKWEDDDLNYKDRIRLKNDKGNFWIRFEDIDEILEIPNDIKKIIENGEFDND